MDLGICPLAADWQPEVESEPEGDFVQVKYTNLCPPRETRGWAGKYDFRSGFAGFARSLAFPGSDQAREGRLVDALAVRGDEGRDTLR